MIEKILKTHNLDCFLLPSNDEFMSEYVPEHLNNLKHITGFTGSNGLAFCGQEIVFLTDGRYINQASIELGKGVEICLLSEEMLDNIFAKYAGRTIGFSPTHHTERQFQKYDKIAKKHGVHFIAIDGLFAQINLQFQGVNKIWELDLKYAGISRDVKIKSVCELMQGDVLLITDPASICWLLNIRGTDVDYNPVALSYLLLNKSGEYQLFTDSISELKWLKTQSLRDVYDFFANLPADIAIQVDDSKASRWFFMHSKKIVAASDPCEKLKAVKNDVEIDGFRKCHVEDGKAIVKFIDWLKANISNGISEFEAAEKLLEFRKESPLFYQESFATISAYAANGAIIHYHPMPDSCKIIGKDSLYLLDSGGHYLNGTTDVTRVLCFGDASLEMKRAYTLVLKGHIALATIKFPEKTTGGQLDAIARQYLWGAGMDYAHGTGHGVGHILSVHEGPQRISKAAGAASLEEGMIISNEPGYYKNGEFGIRIESLMLVVKSRMEGFLEFEILTRVQIDMSMVDESMLTPIELDWVKSYNAECV